MSENEQHDNGTSRRALLAAAAGGAAALAAQAALPLAAQAHDVDDVQLGVTNTATSTTGIDSSATADVNAFAATAGGTGSAVVATSANGEAIVAANTGNDLAAGAYVTSGDTTNAVDPANAAYTGAYVFTPSANSASFVAAGVWGDSEDIGVFGSGGTGVSGFGYFGVYGESAAAAGTGVYARGYTAPGSSVPSGRALYVDGKVGFRRSGKTSISAGHSSKVVNVSGVTSSSLVFAQLGSNRSGRWVRAVVAATGKFTIYLNTTVSSTTSIIWWVIN